MNKIGILLKVLIAFLGFGVSMGLIFPVYAQFFVHWKDGMFPWFLLGCIVAGVMIGIFNYLILKFILIRKLEQIGVVANSISNKDLTQKINIESNDIVGKIAHSVEMMTEHLRQIILTMKQKGLQMNEASKNIHQFLTQANTDLKVQKEHIVQNKKSVETLTSTFISLVNESQQMILQSDETERKARGGGNMIALLSEDMKKFQNMLVQILESVKSLTDGIGKIGNMISMIQEIAQQTNLISFNASAEAARAGEFGRTFSVVAFEIGELSQRTKVGANEINSTLKVLTKSAHQANELMETNNTSMDQRMKETSFAYEDMKTLIHEVVQMAEIMKTLGSTIAIQAQEIQSVQEGLSSIFEAINNVGRLIEEGMNKANTVLQLSSEISGEVEDFNTN